MWERSQNSQDLWSCRCVTVIVSTTMTRDEIYSLLQATKDGSIAKKLQAEVTELKAVIADQKKLIREQKREIKNLRCELKIED